MKSIPKSALWLGLAGLIPFLVGAVVSLGGEIQAPEGRYPAFIPRDGLTLMASYGVVILSFMSGVLWGFAAKSRTNQLALYLALSVVPALYCFFYVAWGAPLDERLVNLIIGFVGLLVLDYIYARNGLAPDWWMTLRVLLTTIVVACLAIGAFV